MRRPWWVLAAAAVVGLVTWRAATHPVDTYGDSGAGYIEHLERVRVLHRLSASGGSLLDRLRAADGLYPPGLHLLTAPASVLGEHHPASVAVLGAGWLLLLGLAVAMVARTLHPRAGAPAFVATLLVPALHAVAPRYYYDLPMTALVWCAAAALAWTHRRPVAGALVAAVTFALACTVKWSALPLGLSVALGGLVLARSHAGGRTFRAAGIWTVSTAGLVVPLLAVSTSFGAMGGATFQPPPGVDLPAWAAALDSIRPGLGHALGSMATQARLDGAARLAFYIRRTATTVLAPALVPFALGVMGLWLRKQAPGRWAMLVMGLPVLLFVWLAVPPLDERFLLTVLPILPLMAGVTLADDSRFTRAFGSAAMVVAVAVAVDFHTGPPASGPRTDVTTGHRTPLRWGLSTSIDRRGWARLTDLPDHQDDLRQGILEIVDTCGATRITGDDALVTHHGDLNWWTFALERATLADSAPRRVFHPFGSGLASPDEPPTLAVIRPDAPSPTGFEQARVDLSVEVWRAPGTCTRLPGVSP